MKSIFPKMIDTFFVVIPDFNETILEIGASTAYDEVGLVSICFNPSDNFVGSFTVLARPRGETARANNAPFLPVSYIAVNTANVAGDRGHSHALISDVGIIEVPANGLSVALQVACSVGSCDVFVSRLSGTSGSL